MSVQIIERHFEDEQIKKQSIRGVTQISLNSDGHLVVRIITTRNDDELLVFDQDTTRKIIRFVKQKLHSRAYMQETDLPF